MSALDIEVIRAFVEVAKDDNTLITSLKAERVTLVTEIATNPEASKEITTGAGNGLSMGANITWTKADKLKFLNQVITAIDNNYQMNSVAYARFC